MHSVVLQPDWDGQAWRDVARAALRADVPPDQIGWEGAAQAGLAFGGALADLPPVRAAPRVSREFLALADAVLCHRDPQRHALLYRLLWRISHGEPRLLELATDADVHRARELEKSVRRDCHKMKAFVRFRAIPGQDNAFLSWFEPDHYIVDRVAPFFARRFAGMRWAILTPYRSARWDGARLALGDGAQRGDVPADDAQEDLWRTYYRHIFNPARLNPRMMQQEMAQKYWKLLPEAQLLPGLIREAGVRVRDMAEREAEAPRRRIPAPALAPAPAAADTREGLQQAARQCRRCPLWQPATQVVFGEGPATARVMIIGEQPGDEEDLRGRPFVGPAGKLFDRAIAELGLDRRDFYVTNAVKHFRFQQRGKFRLHRNPEVGHVDACRGWLERELALVQPRIIVCLGATATRALLGKPLGIGEHRGRWLATADHRPLLVTAHPSAVLRQPADQREAAWQAFRNDLGLLRDRLAADSTAAPPAAA